MNWEGEGPEGRSPEWEGDSQAAGCRGGERGGRLRKGKAGCWKAQGGVSSPSREECKPRTDER